MLCQISIAAFQICSVRFGSSTEILRKKFGVKPSRTAKNCPARVPVIASAISIGVGLRGNLPKTSAAITSSIVLGFLLISAVLRSFSHQIDTIIIGPLRPNKSQPIAPCSINDHKPSNTIIMPTAIATICQALPNLTENRAFWARKLS